MVNINVFREHLRLMTPMEMCLCMEDGEIIAGLSTLAPDERICFFSEFENELKHTIQRFKELKAKDKQNKKQK